MIKFVRHIVQAGVQAGLLTGIAVSAPAAAAPHEFPTIDYVKPLHKWSVGSWTIWALPGHECLALKQETKFAEFSFWGFRVVDGLDAHMIFGAVADARQQTIRVDYDGMPSARYPAVVEPFLDYNAYVVPINLEDIWAFQDELFFDVYAGGEKVTWGGTKVMGKVAEGLEKCDNWQQAH